MAGSTVIQKFQSDRFYLKTVWSSSENITDNTSSVNAKLYVGSTGGYSAVGSNLNYRITINGNSKTDSGVSYNISAGGEVYLGQHTVTVAHDSDGTKSITISVLADGNAYLGGGSDSFTARLDTIPRKSKLTTTPSWEAGSNLTLNISRYSSSFRHEIELYIKHKTTGEWEHVKQIVFDAGETSKSTAFSTANNEELYDHLNGNSTAESYLILQTYSGSTYIGSNYYNGTITAKLASTLSSSASFTIGEPVDVSISRDTSAFTHTVRFYVNNVLIKTLTGVETSATWTPTTTEKNNMYQQTVNSNSIASKIEVDTYYASEMVRNTRTKTGTATVKNSNPTFTGTGITYKDSNTVTSALTGNDQFIIQKKSTVQVTIPAINRAIGTNYATMVNYTATLNGVSLTQNWHATNAIVFNMGVADSKSDLTLSIKAKDSRGNTTTITKIIKMLPYLPPVALPSVERLNGIEAPTAINIAGSFYPLTIGGVVKNALTPIVGQTSAIQYRYKENTSSAAFPTTWTNMTFPAPTSAGKFTANPGTETLDIGKAYVFEIRVTDKLSTETFTITVSKGTPLFALDSVRNSIGFNSTPTQKDTFEMFGKMLFDRNKYATGTSNDAPINFNNSDVIGANGIWLNDTAENNGEGINFPKTGTSTAYDTAYSLAGWNNFRILDDVGYMDGSPVIRKANKVLWSGGAYPVNTSYINFNGGMKISEEATVGIVLVFSDYDAATATANDSNISTYFVPKDTITTFSGVDHYIPIANGGGMTTATPNTAIKIVYLTDTGFKGHVQNSGGTDSAAASYAVQRDIVMRYIIAI